MAAELPSLMSGKNNLLTTDKAGTFRCPVRILQIISGRPIAIETTVLPRLSIIKDWILFSAYRADLLVLPITGLPSPPLSA